MSADRTQLTATRRNLHAARTAFTSALFAAQQTPSPGAAEVLEQARSSLGDARTALHAGIVDWLRDVSPDADLGRLNAQVPIVCLPVRLETRFIDRVLKLRVFPDEIFLNSHEEALTPAELEAARAYHTANENQHRELWRQLVQRFGANRAAYVLRITTPEGGTPPDDIAERSAAWTRASEALLPDRWVVMTRRGNVRSFFAGNPIPEPLAMTPDPSASAEQQARLPNGYAIDRKLLWTVDFSAAESIGMALSIPLSADDARLGFDRIVVFGVKTSLGAEETGDAIEQLFDAQHYTRGLSLVAQGSVTNNTKDRPTAYPPSDEAGEASFAIERANPPTLRRGSDDVLPPPPAALDAAPDGFYWSRLIGVNMGVLRNVDRALEFEQYRGSIAGQVMWPLTFGSFLKFMMDPVLSERDITDARTYFNLVSARGMAPAFRIGHVPYGVLPVTSLRRWVVDTTDSAEAQRVEGALLGPLQRLLSIWKRGSAKVARINPDSATPDLDLISALSLMPSTREVRTRYGFGEGTLYHSFQLFGWDAGLSLTALDQATRALFGRLGHPEWRPRLGRTLFFSSALLCTGPLLDVPANLSETQPLQENYLATLAAADTQLLDDSLPRPNPEPIFYQLLRTAALTEYALVADRRVRESDASYEPWRNLEIFGLSVAPPPSIVSMLRDPFPPLNPSVPLIAYARRQTAYSAYLGLLSTASSAELERLLCEQLDLASHRVDAWPTAMAARRALNLRRTAPTVRGSHLAGYGWLEDVRPLARASGVSPDGSQAEVDATNGGFIHCPSSAHAMTAAALRSGHLSFRGEAAEKYAVDLSSARVRAATWLLDGVRNGQHVGALLGYRFERALSDGEATVPGLNALRFAFRALFPMVAGKDGSALTPPMENLAARHAVDGLALYRAHRAGALTFGTNGLPPNGSPQQRAIVQELERLGTMLDAVADLLVAEGVYQLARGNITGASASLDQLVAGELPPDAEIARSPRSGVGVTHKVVYVFPENAPVSPPAQWSAPLSPRARVDPVLNAWLGELFGDPRTVSARVRFTDAAGPRTASVRLAELALQPLDLLALVAHQSALEAQIVNAAVGTAALNGPITVDWSPAGAAPASDRTFPELAELAAALTSVLTSARPLAAADLSGPGEPQAEPDFADAVELHERAEAAVAALADVLLRLRAALPASFDPTRASTAELDALRAALRAATGIAIERPMPQPGANGVALHEAARTMLSELERRQKIIPVGAPHPSPQAVLARAQETLRAIFGADVLALPRVSLPTPTLTASFAAESTLLGPDKRAAVQFLKQAMHARPTLGKWRKFSLYARALGQAAPRLDVVQLPIRDGERWLGLPFTSAPDESRTSLVLLAQGARPNSEGTWRGIVLDSWTEIIPATTQATSIAFHHASPRAEAPQCVLVAVAPDTTAGRVWSAAQLAEILEETLDLAKIRAVDRELVDVGQLVPAIVIPNNLEAAMTTSSGPIGPVAEVPAVFSRGFF